MTEETTECRIGSTTIEAIERELWTNSRSKCFLQCQREHLYRYVLGYSAASERSALLFGTLVHAGLEAWWGNPNKLTRLESSVSAFRKAAPSEYDPYEAAKIEALLIGYDTRWGAEDFTTLAVEREFRTSLVASDGTRSDNFDRAGKIDAIAFDNRTRRTVGIEHKTSSLDIDPGSDYWKTLRVDGQATGYFHGAASHGFDLDVMIYDMIGKPGKKPLKATPKELRKYTKPTKKEPIPRLYSNQREVDESVEEYFQRVAADIAENPDDYYQRVPIVRLEDEMIEHGDEFFSVAEHAASCARVGFAPKNTSACRRYGTLCEYLPVCTGESTLENRDLYTKNDKQHAELSREVQQ